MAIKITKKTKRLRRAQKTRHRVTRTAITVHKTPRHMRAQLVDAAGRVLACASTLESELRKSEKYTGNVEAAKKVGAVLAERAIKAGLKEVAFDRSGYKYHGRVKALADGAREGGLAF